MQLRLQHTCQPYRSLSQVGRTVLQNDVGITVNSEHHDGSHRLPYNRVMDCFRVMLACRVCNVWHVVQGRGTESRFVYWLITILGKLCRLRLL